VTDLEAFRWCLGTNATIEFGARQAGVEGVLVRAAGFEVWRGPRVMISFIEAVIEIKKRVEAARVAS